MSAHPALRALGFVTSVGVGLAFVSPALVARRAPPGRDEQELGLTLVLALGSRDARQPLRRMQRRRARARRVPGRRCELRRFGARRVHRRRDARCACADAGGPSRSLRFFGHGREAVDRVVIPLDTRRVRGTSARETSRSSSSCACARETIPRRLPRGNDGWIYGHVVVDRDVYGGGDRGDYGLSIFDGVVAFGLASADVGLGLCGRSRLDDERWHHIAVTRELASRRVVLYVDGLPEAEGIGRSATCHTGTVVRARTRTTRPSCSAPRSTTRERRIRATRAGSTSSGSRAACATAVTSPLLSRRSRRRRHGRPLPLRRSRRARGRRRERRWVGGRAPCGR
jgi:hypothetical protein